MAPRQTLRAFLAKARSALTAPPSQRPAPLTFVVGNESADLDSLCSALLLAYFRTHDHGGCNALHIPLCHLPRADLALRPEFAAVLADAGAGTDDVITLDELPARLEDLRPEDTRWLLVDHNALTGRLGKYGDRVVGCIDHHVDEGKVPRDGSEVRIVEKSGSCMSLVVNHCRAVWDALSSNTATQEEAGIDTQLAHLALGPLLIDTTNLSDTHKTTAHDENAVELAENKLRGPISSSDLYDRSAFFARVSALKEDISQMSFRDILRKDFKEWTEGAAASLKLGTSAMPQPFAYIIEKKASIGGEGSFVEELEKWSAEKGIDLVVVLNGFKNDGGEFQRELLVWGRDNEEAVKAAKAFAEANAEKLQLRPWGNGKLDLDDGIKGWRRCWTQGRLENSRKQIAPMLRDALGEQTKIAN
ncbi:exopolyphosphatase [Biscogniauxia marginata]|nr:exopolyphosphatase [Biscogniauxia marginata]